MATRTGWNRIGSIKESAKSLAEQDQAVHHQKTELSLFEDDKAPLPAEKSEKIDNDRILLSSIQPRAQDTRLVSPFHVVTLAESIAETGLIEPIVIDKDAVLLAGAHRFYALRLLSATTVEERTALLRGLMEKALDKAKEQPNKSATLHYQKWQKAYKDEEIDERIQLDKLPTTAFTTRYPTSLIPVHILQFRAADDPELALVVEASENAQRRNYTPTEVRKLYDDLLSRGYVSRVGRSKTGEKAAKPALAKILGITTRAIEKSLANERKQRETQDAQQKAISMGASIQARVETKETTLTPLHASLETLLKSLEDAIYQLEQSKVHKDPQHDENLHKKLQTLRKDVDRKLSGETQTQIATSSKKE